MFAALALLGSVSAIAGDYVIHAGRLIDGNSSKAMEQMSVLNKDQQIVGIEKGYVAATDGQEVIDLKTHSDAGSDGYAHPPGYKPESGRSAY